MIILHGILLGLNPFPPTFNSGNLEILLRSISFIYQRFQVPKMEVLNLISFIRLFLGVEFPLHKPNIHRAENRFGFLHFRYQRNVNGACQSWLVIIPRWCVKSMSSKFNKQNLFVTWTTKSCLVHRNPIIMALYNPHCKKVAMSSPVSPNQPGWTNWSLLTCLVWDFQLKTPSFTIF